MSPIQKINNLSNYVKAIVAVVSFCFTVVGVVWALDNRYVSNEEAAKSLELFQQKLQYENSILESKIEDLHKTMTRKELSYVQEQYYKLKNLLVQHPDDAELKIEFEELKAKKSRLESELN